MISLLWCPVCGRDDRYVQMSRTAKHYNYGKLCPGKPVSLYFELKEDS